MQPDSFKKEQPHLRFDWFAVGVVSIVAAVFATAAHLNAQPAVSLVPAAILSATGCGLLVTAMRKLRTFKGAGVFEAALGGLLLTIFQFIAALTFAGIPQALSADPLSQPGFYTTWGLVAIFSIVFSMAGAALGHLAFAPPRPLPVRTKTKSEPVKSESVAEDEVEGALEPIEDTAQAGDAESQDNKDAFVDEQVTPLTRPTAQTEPGEPASTVVQRVPESVTPARSSASYMIAILLLGLAPTLVGYVFAAAFDVTLARNNYLTGPFPTLRLLSTLLPWQVPLPGPGTPSFTLSQLWRIPLFFGNPSRFDIQALEPFVFNAAALGLLLLTTYRQDHPAQAPAVRLPWGMLLILEAALGLILVAPADLWIIRGIQGLVQFQSIAIPIRALQILDPPTFWLNLITGPLVCMLIGIACVKLRRA